MTDTKIIAPPPGWLAGDKEDGTARTVTIVYDRMGDGSIGKKVMMTNSHPISYFEIAGLLIGCLQTSISGIEQATILAAVPGGLPQEAGDDPDGNA